VRDRRLTMRTCYCDHSENAHQHYRAGTDCAGCSCPAFAAVGRRLRNPLAGFIVRRRWRRWIRHAAQRPAVATARRNPTTGLFE
jgi:hypothetical protein